MATTTETAIVILGSSAAHDDALMQLCSSFGEVVQLSRSSSARENAEAAVMVSYEDALDAVAAVGNMNGMSFHGVFLRVMQRAEFSRYQQQQHRGPKKVVGSRRRDEEAP